MSITCRLISRVLNYIVCPPNVVYKYMLTTFEAFICCYPQHTTCVDSKGEIIQLNASGVLPFHCYVMLLKTRQFFLNVKTCYQYLRCLLIATNTCFLYRQYTQDSTDIVTAYYTFVLNLTTFSIFFKVVCSLFTNVTYLYSQAKKMSTPRPPRR